MDFILTIVATRQSAHRNLEEKNKKKSRNEFFSDMDSERCEHSFNSFDLCQMIDVDKGKH